MRTFQLPTDSPPQREIEAVIFPTYLADYQYSVSGERRTVSSRKASLTVKVPWTLVQNILNCRFRGRGVHVEGL